MNTNSRFLDGYEGADGIKTGYTVPAGFNLTASAKRGDKRIIATVFGGTSTAQRNAKMVDLMNKGFAMAKSGVREAALPLLQFRVRICWQMPRQDPRPGSVRPTLRVAPPRRCGSRGRLPARRVRNRARIVPLWPRPCWPKPRRRSRMRWPPRLPKGSRPRDRRSHRRAAARWHIRGPGAGTGCGIAARRAARAAKSVVDPAAVDEVVAALAAAETAAPEGTLEAEAQAMAAGAVRRPPPPPAAGGPGHGSGRWWCPGRSPGPRRG